ncbi:conserved protein of unknown function [Paraburkholderia kururiensis]
MYASPTRSAQQSDMRRLKWNYARPSYATRPWIIAGAIAFIGCGHALWWRDALLVQRDRIVEQAHRLVPKNGDRQPSMKSANSSSLGSVFAEMRYPWTDMLDRLRAATQPGVELLTLEPDAGEIHRIRISGTANQSQSIFALITTLQSDPAWSSVQLVNQTKNDVANLPPASASLPPLPGTPGPSGTGVPMLSFSLIAEWRQP